MQAGRIPDDGFLLLTSAPYEEVGTDRARAELKTRFLTTFASTVIHSHFPKLAMKMHSKTAVLSWRSRTLKILPEE